MCDSMAAHPCLLLCPDVHAHSHTHTNSTTCVNAGMAGQPNSNFGGYNGMGGGMGGGMAQSMGQGLGMAPMSGIGMMKPMGRSQVPEQW